MDKTDKTDRQACDERYLDKIELLDLALPFVNLTRNLLCNAF